MNVSMPVSRRAPTRRRANSRRAVAVREPEPSRTSGVDLDLVPGARDRLRARLVAMGVPPEKMVSRVARLTGRAVQTVRRWFDAQTPGLPDVESFARLCLALGCTADEILGLPTTELDRLTMLSDDHQLFQVANCVQAMAASLRIWSGVGEPLRVPGDEMAPRLCEGDMVFVDAAAGLLSGNGVYALECEGRVIIRRVEHRPGRGLVLKCDNKAYGDLEVKDTAQARRMKFKVLGKVQGAIGMRLF